MIKFSRIMTALIFVFLIGCAKHNFIPDRLPMPEGLIPEFTASNTIQIINESDPKMNDVNVIVAPFNNKALEWINYMTWTDEIIDILKNELVKRGIKVDNESERTVKIKLRHVYFSVPFMGFHVRTYLTLEVSLGEFYTKTFSNILGKSGINNNKSSANAMLHAVETILNDAEIQKYLRGAPDYSSSWGKQAHKEEETTAQNKLESLTNTPLPGNE